MKMKNEEVKNVREKHIIQILSNLYEDFWSSDEITHFRNPIIDYNYVLDRILSDKVISDLSIFASLSLSS